MFTSIERWERQSRRLSRWLPAPTAEAETLHVSSPYDDDQLRSRYADDLVGFARDVLGIELWSKQAQAAELIEANTFVAICSGNKVGKSLLCAIVCIWWVLTRENGRAIITAPTERQIKKAVWKEIRLIWRSLAKRGLSRLLPKPGLSPATGCRWEDGRELSGFSAANQDNTSGPSGADTLVVVDEASGVPNEIYEALQGIISGGGRLIAISNPTQPSGWFFDAFHEAREGWARLTISQLENPNCVEGRQVIPGLAMREFSEREAKLHGASSPLYQVRVLGKFPTASSNQVVPLGLIEDALKRWDEQDALTVKAPCLDLGVDVALYGDDDSAICARRANVLYSPDWIERWYDVQAVANGYDHGMVTGMVVQVLRAMRRGPAELVRVKVDAGGGYGEAVCTALRELIEANELPNVEVLAVNVARAPADTENYPQARDEIWFGLKEFFQDPEAMLAPDGRLESEATAPTYAITRKGQRKVADKAAIKKRIGRSPDRADAACLAVYEDARTVPLDVEYLNALNAALPKTQLVW